MRLHHIVECDTRWSMRLIESSAGWTLPKHYFPEVEAGVRGYDNSALVLFVENGIPKWIGVFNQGGGNDLVVIQQDSDEIIVPGLSYKMFLLSINLRDPSIYYEVKSATYLTRAPRIQFLTDHLLLVNDWGFEEIKDNKFVELFSLQDSNFGMSEYSQEFIILYVRSVTKTAYVFELAGWDDKKLIIKYDPIDKKMISQYNISEVYNLYNKYEPKQKGTRNWAKAFQSWFTKN